MTVDRSDPESFWRVASNTLAALVASVVGRDWIAFSVVLRRNPPEKVEGGVVPEVGSSRTMEDAVTPATPASMVAASVKVVALPTRTPVAKSVANGVVSKVKGPTPDGPTETAASSLPVRQDNAAATRVATSPRGIYGLRLLIRDFFITTRFSRRQNGTPLPTIWFGT